MPAVVDAEQCNACKSCEEVCPSDAIKVQADTNVALVIDDDCIDCNACVDVCTSNAITMK